MKFTPFGSRQCLPDNKILKLVQFSLPGVWIKELIIQGFDSANQEFTDLVQLCKSLETSKKNFQKQGEGNHKKKKKPGSPVNATNLSSQLRAKGIRKTIGRGCKNQKNYICALYIYLEMIWNRGRWCNHKPITRSLLGKPLMAAEQVVSSSRAPRSVWSNKKIWVILWTTR